MSDSYEVLVTPRAIEMLMTHVRFLARINKQAARELNDTFHEKAATLEQMPERCPWLSYPGIPVGKYRKLIFRERYLAICQIKGKRVYIHYVVDTRSNYQWLIE
jgi:plasmid stabilization system protein ParE